MSDNGDETIRRAYFWTRFMEIWYTPEPDDAVDAHNLVTKVEALVQEFEGPQKTREWSCGHCGEVTPGLRELRDHWSARHQDIIKAGTGLLGEPGPVKFQCGSCGGWIESRDLATPCPNPECASRGEKENL